MSEPTAPATPSTVTALLKGRPGWVLAVVALATVPRVVSMVADPLWVEDEAYLNCALAIARGELPYHDFVLQHTPVLEWLTAALLTVTGPSVTAVMVATQLLVVLLTGLVALVGLRLGGPRAAAVAAVLVAASPLLWRYRLFHRELVVAVPLVAAVVLLVSTRRTVGRAVAVGVLAAGAVLVKFTAVGYAAAVIAAMALDRSWGPRPAAWAAGALGGTVATALAAFATAFGTPFVAQALLFGAQHPGFDDPLLKILIVGHDLAPLLVAASIGALVVVLRGAGRRWLPVLLPLFLGGAFTLVLKPIGWGHNVLELLPWSALAAAAALDLAGPAPRPAVGRVGLAAAVAALLGVSAAWFLWGPPPRGPVRWMSRAEVHRQSEVVRTWAPPDRPVFVPSLVAFAADRRELVTNFEIAAWSRQLTAEVARRGVAAVVRDLHDLRRRPYFETVDRSLTRTADAAVASIRRRRVAVVATPLEIARSPAFPFGLEPTLLRRSGYRSVDIGRSYVLWAAPSAAGVETLNRRP